MTDKQIIIDGVDVISCNHFDINFKHCDILGRLCREHNNCYYKQLLRKEQESEELKKATITLAEGLNFRQQLVEKLKQTLAKIKEIAKPFCEECKEFGSMPNERYCMYCNYNKILQKISEISDGRSPVSEQMTTTVPTARSWNSVSTKKFQDSEVENDR